MDSSKNLDGPQQQEAVAEANLSHLSMATAAAAAASGGPESTQCRVCSKRVYEMEKLVADNMVYHKTCFKCCKCTRTLRVGNYASMDAQIFCKPHFIECFKQKGNYEEGFGKERHKNKWLKSEDSSENEAGSGSVPEARQ